MDVEKTGFGYDKICVEELVEKIIDFMRKNQLTLQYLDLACKGVEKSFRDCALMMAHDMYIVEEE